MSFTNTKSKHFGDVDLPYKADAVINPGEIVVLSAGYAKEGATASSLVAVGISVSPAINNTGGTDGAGTVVIETSYPKSGGRRIFWLKNDTSTNALSQADVGSDCYVKNATTVSKNSSSASKAGKVVEYDAKNDLVGVLFNQFN